MTTAVRGRFAIAEKQRRESGDEAEAAKAAPGIPLGLGLVLVGAAAMAIAAFLPFAQPVYGLPVL
ncbi:hypothetical protein, partial [Mycobacterium sp.]|uniref:hypothetical protein n=1 Tax=Mycobacterium sp. TaxID=1785 RepID=UPI003C77E37E